MTRNKSTVSFCDDEEALLEAAWADEDGEAALEAHLLSRRMGEAPMGAPEFRGCLDRLGLSQAEAARVLRYPPRQVSRWASPSDPTSVRYLARFALRLMVRHRVALP